MKPTLFLPLVAAIALMATGCGSGSDTAGNPPPPAAAPTAGTAKAPAAGSFNAKNMTPGPGTATFGTKG
jgi:hypothetical protein